MLVIVVYTPYARLGVSRWVSSETQGAKDVGFLGGHGKSEIDTGKVGDAQRGDAGDGEEISIESDDFRIVMQGEGSDEEIQGTRVDAEFAAVLPKRCGFLP